MICPHCGKETTFRELWGPYEGLAYECANCHALSDELELRAANLEQASTEVN